jgi:hypothetical protein
VVVVVVGNRPLGQQVQGIRQPFPQHKVFWVVLEPLAVVVEVVVEVLRAIMLLLQQTRLE